MAHEVRQGQVRQIETELGWLGEKLKQQAGRWEVVGVENGFGVMSLFNPRGVELKAFLDKGHMPRMTNFDTVIVSPDFAGLRFLDKRSWWQPPELTGYFRCG